MAHPSMHQVPAPARADRSLSHLDSHRALILPTPGATREVSDQRRITPVVWLRGLNGLVELWIETSTEWATAPGLETFVFWPADATAQQVRLFAEEVVLAVLRRSQCDARHHQRHLVTTLLRIVSRSWNHFSIGSGRRLKSQVAVKLRANRPFAGITTSAPRLLVSR